MKRFLFTWAVLLTAYGVFAQNVNVTIVAEQCPGCYVVVKGRHLQPSDHKSGCWWLARQQSQQTSSSSSEESGLSWGKSPYSDSKFFGLVEGKPLTNDEYYELLLRTHCDYCGGDFTKHSGGCIIGSVFNDWQRTMKAGNEKDATRLRDNVVTLFLATDSGKEKLHQMRGTTAPKPAAEKPSTHLRDYTPASEKPAISVSAPMIPCPLAQPAPQFSGINLQSVVHEKMQNTSGVHEWGEMHERYIQYPIEYDIERWTHTKGGAVILGKRNPDGTVKWYRLHPDKSGKYVSETALGYVNTRDGKELALKDIRFEAEGQFIVEEYEGGYKIYKDPASGYWVANGYNVKIAPMKVDGRYFVIEQKKDSEGNPKTCLHAGLRNFILAEDMVLFDDAIVQRNSYGDCLLNWNWQALDIDGNKFFKDIRCMRSDRGSYYVIEVTEGQFALVSRGFRQVGGIYGSAKEALAAWDNQ